MNPGADRTFGRARVVAAPQNGKYPSGNSLWIEGTSATAVVDPSLAVHGRSSEFSGRADLVMLSHAHEDHVAGLGLFPGARVAVHHDDALGARSLDGLMQMYGYQGEAAAQTRELVEQQFHYTARPDAEGFDDGAVFDLGDVSVRVFHTPGHTRGHSVLRIEPEGVLFLGDIELSSFGPYYGDAWSDLDDFEKSLELVRRIDANAWVSFHHVGVIDDRAQFLTRLDRFAARIAERELAMIEFLREPRSLAAMIAHRFLYPPHAKLPFIDAVEKRSIEQHLARMENRGQVGPAGDGLWVATV
jgi:glyoxylase-like metal-dependent hydrolase (beta-lactamase superfamily II)